MTLRQRIAAVAGAAVAVTVLLGAVAVFLIVRSELRGQIDGALRQRAEQVLRHPDPDRDRDLPCAGGGALALPQGADDDLRFGGAEGIVQLVCRDGTVVRAKGSAVELPVGAAARALAAAGHGERIDDLTVGGASLRVLTRGWPQLGAIQVARPLGEADRELDRILAALTVVAAIGIALAIALGALVARTALAPIARFTRASEALAHDPDVSERMQVRGDDELARLARSFNATLDALERSVRAQRHLVADASHELRTPIATLRANVQTLEHAARLAPAEREALRADVVAELDELTALVADVVELARDGRAERELDDVRLDRIVRDLAERPRLRDAALELDLEPTIVRGEPDRVERAVSNLIDNALKWSPPGAPIELRLRDGTLSVRDHGPGFGADDLPHVFERFFRADAARGMPGSGLGLAIVKQTAEAHGGGVRAANAPGGGALLQVRFMP